MRQEIRGAVAALCAAAFWGQIPQGSRSGPESAVGEGPATRSSVAPSMLFAPNGSRNPSVDGPMLQNLLNGASVKTLVLPAGIYALGSTLVVPAGRTLSCQPGAALLKQGNFDLVGAAGDNVTVEGCALDGARAGGFLGNVISAHGVSNLTLRHNTVMNAAGNGINLTAVVGFRIEQNAFSGNLYDAIFGENNTTDGIVHDNDIDTASVSFWHHGIGFHSTAPGKIVKNIQITSNRVKNGRSFCVEIGSFGGLHPTGVVVTGNSCYQVVNAVSFGGYSFDTTDSLTVTGNLYESAYLPTLPGLELVGGKDATAVGNHIDGEVALDRQIDSTVGNNLIHGNVHITSSVAGQNVTQNKLLQNTILVQGPTIKPAFPGVWVQCNAVGANCSGNQIEGNTILGSANPHAVVVLENDAGTTNNSVVRNNYADGFLGGCVVNGSGGANAQVLDNVGPSCLGAPVSGANSPPAAYRSGAAVGVPAMGWTWDNQGNSTVDYGAGYPYLHLAATSTVNLRLLYRAAPATPYSITAAISRNITGQGLHTAEVASAIGFRDSAGKLIAFQIGRGVSGTCNIGVSTFSTANGSHANVAGWHGSQSNRALALAPRVWMKMADDGANYLTFYYSVDSGNHWVKVAQLGRTAYLPSGPTQVWVGGCPNATPVDVALESWVVGSN